jgi:hypothetical protein
MNSRIFKGMGDMWRLTDHCQTYIRHAWSYPPWFLHDDASWHQGLVMWSFLVQLYRWNTASDAEGHVKIQTVLMKGLGTGTRCIEVDK